MKFAPFDNQYLASASDSIIFWNLGSDYSETYGEELKTSSDSDQDDCIILNHIGHIGTVSDFEWNPILPWTVISASDDSDTFTQIQKNNDCSMQIFRPINLLTEPEQEALEHMVQHL